MASHGPVKFDAYIVDPELDSRMRLKTATTAVHNFGKVHQLGTLREAVQRLGTSDRCDVMFVSHRFDKSEIQTFVRDAKKTQQGQDTAYILMLNIGKNDAATVATNVMMGVDGFLFEPYSVDQLLEITLLAQRVKKERSNAREKAAMQFLITDVITQIDLIAYLKSCGYEVSASLKKFKEMCSVLTRLEGDSINTYYEVAIKMFEEAPLPTKIVQTQKKYGGASSRVKKKLGDKVAAELEKDAASKKAAIENSGG